MKKILPLSIVIVVIIVVIGFIEMKQNDTKVVLEDGEVVVTGLITSNDVLVGKNIGNLAPNWVLQSFDGELIELADLRGTPVMLDYFADWCPFCHEEFPFIEAAHKEYGDSVEIIGIHRSDTESIEKGESFARGEAAATFTLVKDTSGDVYGAYTSGPAMPISFFIDRDGIIRDKVLGPKTPERLVDGLQIIIEN